MIVTLIDGTYGTSTGSVVRGYIGVFIGDLTPELAASFQFKGRDGILVQDLEKAGPGAAAGLKPGDIEGPQAAVTHASSPDDVRTWR